MKELSRKFTIKKKHLVFSGSGSNTQRWPLMCDRETVTEATGLFCSVPSPGAAFSLPSLCLALVRGQQHTKPYLPPPQGGGPCPCSVFTAHQNRVGSKGQAALLLPETGGTLNTPRERDACQKRTS